MTIVVKIVVRIVVKIVVVKKAGLKASLNNNLREVGVPSRKILHVRGRRSKFRIRVGRRGGPRPPKR